MGTYVRNILELSTVRERDVKKIHEFLTLSRCKQYRAKTNLMPLYVSHLTSYNPRKKLLGRLDLLKSSLLLSPLPSFNVVQN